MLTDLIELGQKMKKTDDGYPNKTFRESRVTGREPGLKAMIWNKRKKETSIQKKKEETRIQKKRTDLGTSGTI